MIAVAGLLNYTELLKFVHKVVPGGYWSGTGIISALEEKKISIHVTQTAIKLVRDGDVLSVCPANIDAVKAVCSDKVVPPTILATLRENLEKAVGTALKEGNTVSSTDQVPWMNKEPVNKVFKPKVSLTMPVGTLPPLEFDENTGQVKVCSLEEMTGKPVVKLRDATRLYQAVQGTGKTSRYFLVAGNEDIRIAARYAVGQLSIRVVGAVSQFKAELVGAGFCAGDNSSYMSVHLGISDDITAMKALGAVLFGTGLVFRTQNPELKVLKHGS